MSDLSRGTDRLGRRAKRFLTPLQKYEIWLQLVRQETTIGEAADRWEVDRSTIMRLREVAKQGALQALAESRPGTRSKEHDLELAQAKAETGERSAVQDVLASEPEKLSGFWLAAGPPVAAIDPEASMSSRAAENLFWLGRYAERTEAMARLVLAFAVK